MIRQPFFIIGAPRSGTTMLQLALGRHSRVAAPPETHFFTLTSRSRRGQRRHWEGLIRKLGIAIDPPPRRIRPGGEAREQFWRIVESYLARVGKESATHVGEKSPEHLLRTAAILETFPEAKFVLIYRDGRDVALSLSKVPWMPRDVRLNFAVWLHYYRVQRGLLREHPQRVICVRYEDLVRQPARELEPVLEFLGLEYEPQVAEGGGNGEAVCPHELSYKARALEPISSGRTEVWKREMSQTQAAGLERWGGWALRELHYECTASTSLIPAWELPWVYGRLAGVVALRTLQRKLDEFFGTCFYWPNRIARDIPAADSADIRPSFHHESTTPLRR
mgnify:CR=1 FL=1|uniref:Sulfotransferase n=1 Tax=Schlesneria paludicola TaxID=360056 RepID=A0A7C4QNP8_9PLAN